MFYCYFYFMIYNIILKNTKIFVLGLFLFPNNEYTKTDGAQLMCLLLYSEHIIRVSEKAALVENSIASHISLPYIVVTNMKLPFTCKSHWKTSIHRRSDVSCKYTDKICNYIKKLFYTI